MRIGDAADPFHGAQLAHARRAAHCHPFLRRVRLLAVPGPSTPLLDEVLAGVAEALHSRGHEWNTVLDTACHENTPTDAFVTTARLHEPVEWRTAPLFTGRKRFAVAGKPASYTFVQATPAQFEELSRQFTAAQNRAPSPADPQFPGLSPGAWSVLRDQGRRGGAIMCIGRLLQAQCKSLRVVLVIGERAAEAAFLFDLAGAHPRIDAGCANGLFGDLALRIATHLGTREVTDHRVEGDPIPRATWAASPGREAVLRASRELGARGFFTQMVRIADLVDVPSLPGAVAQQYSEGCFSTWDPLLQAQVVTATGSEHPVVKGSLCEDDLAVITGVRHCGSGACVRAVEGQRNAAPSSEAVEFGMIDERLPRLRPPPSFGITGDAPATRSKLHGHRGVLAYDPRTVEYVPLAEPFFRYLVTCSTEAQAQGLADAFARSRSLRNPADPRTVVFSILPGHGLLMVEKWVDGARPFDVLLAAMDERRLELSERVPQGAMHYAAVGARRVLRAGAGEAGSDLVRYLAGGLSGGSAESAGPKEQQL